MLWLRRYSLRTTQTRDTTKHISLSLSLLGEAQPNVQKHCYSVSFQEVAMLTEAHDVGMTESTRISFPLTFFSRAGLRYNIICDIARCRLGRGISHGCEGEWGSGEGVG